MTIRAWILVAALFAAPCPSAAQALDSAGAHELALQMAEDIRSFEHLSDVRFVSLALPAIEDFFGIEFELPSTQETEASRARGHLEVTYRELGADALLDEATRLDEGREHPWTTQAALEMVARREGPEVALDAARERGLLEPAFNGLLNGARLERIDSVLAWISDTDLDPELRPRLRTRALQFGSSYEPYRFWRSADSLPEPYRTRVRARALGSTASVDTIPAAVVESALPGMLEVAETLGTEDSQEVARAVALVCARRRLDGCGPLEPPISETTGRVGVDVINLTGSGAYDQAANRLEQLRRTAPPLVVARVMAQGLESAGSSCSWRRCDVVRLDSLAAAWTEEILAVEADAIGGRVERTATWNGREDLTELQRALGNYLAARDLDAARELLGRMHDAGAIGHVLLRLIQTAPGLDLVEAVELYLEHAPDGTEAIQVHYADLVRAGRPDLAGEMLRRASPYAATDARLDWLHRLTDAGRVDEARNTVRELMSEASYEHPVGDGRLLASLERLRALDEYLAHLRALPTPRERVNGIYPLLEAWVRVERLRARAP